MILFAQGDNQRASRIGLGLVLGTGLARTKEIEVLAAKLAAQDAEGPWSIAESPGDLLGGQALNKEGAEGFVLAVGGRLGFEEESSLGR
jgi:hypothetical protein